MEWIVVICSYCVWWDGVEI